MPETETRVVGSGFTTLSWQGATIAFLDQFADSGQTPVARPEAIHPLGMKHPKEIATARAVGAGTLTLTIRELWNEPVWWQLGLTGTYNIVDAYEAIAALPSGLTATMLIKPPGQSTWRGKTFHNLCIVTLPDDENVTLPALTQPRSVVAWYTHTTPIVGVAAGSLV